MVQGSGPPSDEPPIARRWVRVTMGVLEGVIRWGPLACWLLAPAIAKQTGVPSGLVGVLVLCGTILGSWVLVARLGRRRKMVAVSTAALLVVPLLALARPVTGAAAVFALVGVGFLAAGYGAGLSAVAASLAPTTRQRRLVPVRIANSAVTFASGPISQVVSLAGWPRLFEALALAAAAAAVLLAALCPNPDSAIARDEDLITVEAEQGSLTWLSVCMFCGGAQGIAFAVFLPLAAVDYAVTAIGWTQIAMPISVIILLFATRLTAAGRPRHAPESLLRAAALAALSSCAIALGVQRSTDMAGAIFVGWLIARIAGAIGGELYASTVFALAGSSAKGAAACQVGSAIGQLLAGGVGALIWSSVSAPNRFDLVLGFGLACGLMQLIATRQWLASRRGR